VCLPFFVVILFQKFFKDTGGSQLIAEGKVKLKSDSQIESFTETSIMFENGTELAADVVVFATGWIGSRSVRL
jgi:NADH dehydrogenase FAD-containing subunit